MASWASVVKKVQIVSKEEDNCDQNASESEIICSEEEKLLQESYETDSDFWMSDSCWSLHCTGCLRWNCEFCQPFLHAIYESELDDDLSIYNAAKERGPMSGVRQPFQYDCRSVFVPGRTQRLRSAAAHRQLDVFRVQPILYKYVRGSASPTEEELLTRFCEDHVGDDLPLIEEAIPFSHNKRQRWAALEQLETEIQFMDTDREEYDLTLGIREYTPSRGEDACLRRFARSVQSTRGKEKRYHGANTWCVAYSEPNTLLENIERKTKHDWKPEFKRMTHNQHFRGVQRQTMLKSGYKKTLKKILKTEAEDRTEKEKVVNNKPEIIYDVINPFECYTPKITKMLPKHFATEPVYYMRPSKQSQREYVKSRHTIACDRVEYQDFLDDVNNDECTDCPCNTGVQKDKPRDETPLTLADFITTKPKNNQTRGKNLKRKRAEEKKYTYKTPKVEKKTQDQTESEAANDTLELKESEDDEPMAGVEEEVRVPVYQLVTMREGELKPEYLSREFGSLYVEGNCQPRRFIVDTSEDRMSAQVVFQLTRTAHAGLAEVLVRIHSEKQYPSFFHDLTELDDLVTMHDVITAAAKLHVPRAKPKVKVFSSLVDMKHLNEALGNEIVIYDEEDAVKFFMYENAEAQVASRSDGLQAFITEAVRCEGCGQDCWGEEQGYGCGWTCLSECRHVYCNICWCDHLTTNIRRQQPLHCPANNCAVVVDSPTVLSLVDNATYRRYQELTIQSRIEESSDWQRCPNTECRHLAYRKKGCARHGLSVACACGKAWCFSCRQEPHWPATCGQTRNYLAKRSATAGTLTASPFPWVDMKHCPHCHYPSTRENYKNSCCDVWFITNQQCPMCENCYCWDCLSPIIKPGYWPHACVTVFAERVYLRDVLPYTNRWQAAGMEWHARWLLGRSGSARVNTRGGLWRQGVSTLPALQRAITAARIYGHVIEHVLVVLGSFPRGEQIPQFVRALHRLIFITDRLHALIQTTCAEGKTSAESQRRVPALVELGDRNLHQLNLLVRLQQSRPGDNSGESRAPTRPKTPHFPIWPRKNIPRFDYSRIKPLK